MTEMSTRMRRVLLVQMPFFTVDSPSISLSLVKAALERAGHECEIAYFNLEFGQRIGVELYSWIAGSPQPDLLFGDLVFTPSLHGKPISLQHLRQLIAPSGTYGVRPMPEEIVQAFPELVSAAHDFLHEKLRDTDWSAYDLVGFSTMFQIAPALAMARLVKSTPNPPRVMLGGSYCESDMGEYLHRCFPFIDFVCRGEGETLIVELARHLSDGSIGLEQIRGLVWRDAGVTRCNGHTATLQPSVAAPLAHASAPRAKVEYELDALPVPTYHDWMTQVRALGLLTDTQLQLPIETSRGCWWGEKHHCTFCGLNDGTIAYRRKSPQRALDEFRSLIGYGVKMIHAVDEILDFRYLNSVLPELARLQHGCEIFYEIKANLTREHVQLLRDSGIVWLQPGIESLSSELLKLMKKGVTGVQNVRLLKYAAEFRIGVAWNLLYGFPGEDPAIFAAMAPLTKLLSHLQAPFMTVCQVRLQRFAPLYVQRATNGMANVEPVSPYYEVFPFATEVVARMAYYFSHDYVSHPDPSSYIGPLSEGVKAWHTEVGRAAFLSVDRGEALHLIDTRVVASTPRAVLQGLERAVFQACSDGASLRNLTEALKRPEGEIEDILNGFIERNWAIHLDNEFIALAVPMDRYTPAHVPVPMLEHTILRRYCEYMARLQQGDTSGVPPLDRLYQHRRSGIKELHPA